MENERFLSDRELQESISTKLDMLLRTKVAEDKIATWPMDVIQQLPIEKTVQIVRDLSLTRKEDNTVVFTAHYNGGRYSFTVYPVGGVAPYRRGG